MKRVLQSIYRDIKGVKIQGATDIARAAVKAYLIEPTEQNERKLISLRPTEPMLVNALAKLHDWPPNAIIGHFKESQEKINSYVYKAIKGKKIIFTHCHSTNVVKALLYSKKKGRKFSVFLTETRPLYQGRKPAGELASAGINVTVFVDSALHEAISKSDIVLLGSDAILKEGIINKIGSSGIAEEAYRHKKPLYIVADSWKFSPKKVQIEERDFHEVWKDAPKHVTVKNPAFEKVDKKYIKGIVSEYGLLSYEEFLKMAGKD